MTSESRSRIGLLLCALLAACSPPSGIAGEHQRRAMAGAFHGIDDLQAELAAGETTQAEIAADALRRIALLDDGEAPLNAIVETDPGAAERARRSGPHAGLLAGVPFVIKASIDTDGPMRTHAGSLALADRIAADDARLVAALEAEGAILVGKANLSEWANFRSERSVSGWSSVGGQTRNPHVLDRNPCGSSSGSAVAVAAGMVPLAIGTETHGSIVCPAGVNGIVGMKPTLGLVSPDGIVPIAASQDTAGPMTRSVRDAALALQAMAEAGPGAQAAPDLLSGLENQKIEGLRVGVWRAYSGAKEAPRVGAILDDVAARLSAAGATLIDPVGLYLDKAIYDASYRVLLHEFNVGLNAYLAGTTTLAELIEFNRLHAQQVMPWFGQEIFLQALETRMTQAEHAAALDAGQGEMRRRLDAAFANFQLDVIIAPTNGPAWPIDVVQGDRFGVSSAALAAISGRPGITLPAGAIHGLPIGVSVVGNMWRDGELLGIAFALERLLPPPLRPRFLPTLEP